MFPVAMVDMKKSAEQVKDESASYSPAVTEPANIAAYPYGLCICLDNDSLTKLDLEGAEVDDGVQILVMAKVTDVSSKAMADGSTNRRVELQITHMGLGPDHFIEDEST